MKRTDAQKQEPTRANQSNQPFFGTKSASTFFAPGQSVQRDPFFQSSNAPLTTPIQAKLTVGAVGDQYEQEADRVASEVVDRINNPAGQQGSDTQSVQRMGQEEDEVQMKPLADQIQRVELPDDDELQMKSVLQRETDPEEEDELQMKPMPDIAQRVGMKEEDLHMKTAIAPQATAQGGQASLDLESSIQQARGSGQPLTENMRVPLEQAFGADFSGVKVHTDAKSDQLNRSIQAKAFTTGQDVFFRQGEYNPGNPGGQELIAHELTHVVQQNGGVVQRQGAGDVVIQRLSAQGLASILGDGLITKTKLAIGQAAWDYFVAQNETFWPLIDFFVNQGRPITHARDQGEFLKLHLAPLELASAQESLRLLNYDPAGAAAMYTYIHKYRSMDLQIYQLSLAQLATAGNDPVAAEPAMAYLCKYHSMGSGVYQLSLAQLATAGNDPVAAESAMAYIVKYYNMDSRIYNIALAQLATAGNDPVAAESAMTALVPYNYYTMVKQNVDLMAGGKARAEINQEKLIAAQEKTKFEADYLSGMGQSIDKDLTRANANEKKSQFQTLFPNVALDGKQSDIRDKMNTARRNKIDLLTGRDAAIEGQMPARTAQHTNKAQQILAPVYAVNEPEAAANWCLAQTGQDLQLLKSCVDIMVAVNGNISLEAKLNPLDLATKRVLLGKLSNTQQGQLSASGINALVDLLAPLDGTAMNNLVNLLHPALDSQGIDNLALNLLEAPNGTAINTFVRQYVPTISGAQLADMVHRLRPLDITNIDLYINRLRSGLNLGQIHTLTVAMTPGAELIGNDILHLTTTLIVNLPDPLTAVKFNTLVLAMEGVAGDQINTMVNQLIAIGVNTGTNIYGQIHNMRGSLQVGDAKSTDVTALGGERTLSGAQIAGRIGQVVGPVATPNPGAALPQLSQYPHSNIDPVGRAEQLLWQDCDRTVQRHASETAADIAIRQQLALNGIINLPGVNRQIAQRVFIEQDGQQPRALGTAAQEDAISGGHINDRHVLGTGGTINTLAQLQGRANGAVDASGSLIYPPCPGIAGAFASAAASQAGMQNALNAHITANPTNWHTLRERLIRGQTVNLWNVAAAVNGHVARNGHPMNNAPTRIHIQFTGANVNGGFWVFESWPKP